MNRGFRAGIAIAACLLLFATSCGDDGESSDEEGGDVTVTMWVSREQYEPTDSFYDELEKEHPGIKVDVTLVPDDDLFFQLVRMREAGEDLPDIVHLDDYFGMPLYDSGLALPLNDLMARWEKEDPESYNDQNDAVFVTADDDNIVGLAPTGTIDVLYYRTDWFADAGVELPLETWDDVLDAARAVKQAHPDELAWALPATRGQGVNWLLTMMASAGVQFDGAVPDLTSDEGEYVINFLQTLRREDLTSEEVLAWGEDESRGAFIGGQAGILYDGARSTNELGEALTEQGVEFPDGWATMVGPTKTTADSAVTGSYIYGARTWHILETSKHPYEASLALRTYMSHAHQLDSMAVAGTLPMTTSILGSDEFYDAYPFVGEETVEALREAAPRPADSRFFQIVEILEQMVQDCLKDPDTPASEMAAKWQSELDGLAES